MTYSIYRYAEARASQVNATYTPTPFLTVFPREKLNYQTLTAQPSRTVTSLTLLGQFAPGYGEQFNGNLIHLTENFAGTNEPLRAINGQIWYDSSSQTLRYCVDENASTLGSKWLNLVRATTDGNVEAGNIFLNGVPSYRNGNPSIFFSGTTGSDDAGNRQRDRLEFDEATNSLMVILNDTLSHSINSTGVVIPDGRDYYIGTLGLRASLMSLQNLLSGINTTNTSTFNAIAANELRSDRYVFRSDTTTGMVRNSQGGIGFFNGGLSTLALAGNSNLTLNGNYDDGGGGRAFFLFRSTVNSVSAPSAGISHRGSGDLLLYFENTGAKAQVAANLQVDQNSVLYGTVWIGQTLNVQQAASLNSTLTVAGRTNINNNLFVQSDYNVIGLKVTNHGGTKKPAFMINDGQNLVLTTGAAGAETWGDPTVNSRWPLTIRYSDGRLFTGGVTDTLGLDCTGTANIYGALVTNNTAAFRNNQVTIDSDGWTRMTGALYVTSGNGRNEGVLANSLRSTGNGQIDGTLFVNGDIVGLLSDERIKTDVTPLENAMEIARQLKPVRYRDTRTDKIRIGFIAQDVEKVAPEFVTPTPDGLIALDYARLTAVLAGAVNTLADRLNDLETRLTKLESVVK